MFLNCHKVMCSCGICLSTSMIQSELNAWRSRIVEKLRFISEIHIYEDPFKRENNRMIILMEYIQMVLTNTKYQVI